MSDLKLNRNGDLDFSSKRAHLVGGANAVAQQMRIRFRTFLGEWFFDRTAGFPWFQSVLEQKGDVQRFEGLFRNVILTTPKVISIETFSFAFERVTRTLRLTFRAKTSEGVLDFDDAFDLEDEVEAPLRAASTWRTSSEATPTIFEPFEPAAEHYWAMDAITSHKVVDEGTEAVEGENLIGLSNEVKHVGSNLYVEWSLADDGGTGSAAIDTNLTLDFIETEPFTIAAWVAYTDKAPVETVIPLSMGSSIASMKVKDDPRRLFAFYDVEDPFAPNVGVDVGAGPSPGFHLYAVSHDPTGDGEFKFYFDGALVKTQAGQYWYSNDSFSFLGDAVATAKWGQKGLWRVVLAAGEIADLFGRGPFMRQKAPP